MKTIELSTTGIGIDYLVMSDGNRIKCLNGFVKAEDILTLSNDGNVRDVNPKAPVIKDMTETYTKYPEMMMILNKGIACSTHAMQEDRKRGKVVLRQDILDGIMDGGHTQYATRQAKNMGLDISKAKIPIKIFESRYLNSTYIKEISKALNKNTSPSAETLADRAGYTAVMKEAVGDMAKRVEWRENSKKESGEHKMRDYIPAQTWLFLCHLMDVKNFASYKRHGSFNANNMRLGNLAKRFEEGAVNFDYLAPLMPDFARLFDAVYVSYSKNMGTYKRRGIENFHILGTETEYEILKSKDAYDKFVTKPKKTVFTKQNYFFEPSQQFVYAVFNAMRAYIKYDEANDTVSWVVDDICAEFEKIERIIWCSLIDSAKEVKLSSKNVVDTHVLMSSTAVWNNAYLAVERNILIQGL